MITQEGALARLRNFKEDILFASRLNKALTFWDIFASAQIQFQKNGVKEGLIQVETVGELVEGRRSLKITLFQCFNGKINRLSMDFPEYTWEYGFEGAVKTLIDESLANASVEQRPDMTPSTD